MVNENNIFIIAGLFGLLIGLIPVAVGIIWLIRNAQFNRVNNEALQSLSMTHWKYRGYDAVVNLKSAKAVDSYTDIKFFKENRDKLVEADNVLRYKQSYAALLSNFLENNEFKSYPMYSKLEEELRCDIQNLSKYSINVSYVSPAGRSSNQKIIEINRKFIDSLLSDPSVIMGKAEYNKFIKEKTQEALTEKQHFYYEMVNDVIDLANAKKSILVITKDKDELDRLISSLLDKTVNSIKKIKSLDSDEWTIVEKIIFGIKQDVDKIIERNQRIIDYYNSDDFIRIKETCNSLMETQKDFNEYINEKAQSISKLFGSRVVRNETVNNDEYNYIRPYQKSITPFTAEVSATVFASAENNPIDYIVKYFYPNKEQYSEQIQKLQLLIEELETLRDAKEIIENYKKDYKQYLSEVPSYIMENDEDGFYSRLGFANISESVLTVEYKFSYTSDGGMAQRSFTVPMTEETIVELVNKLQSKLTMSAFVKEQRTLMTSKLRQHIKERDNFTCRYCGNSTFAEPNLLLEIDHIIPVAKGGCTTEDNLQTLCWKCNRSKSSKIV